MLLIVTGCTADATPQASGTPVPNGQIDVPPVNIQVPGVSIQIILPGANPLVNKADARGRISSILVGIWHGIISPVTLIISFINPTVQMYEVHNDGSPYNLGFLIGVALVFLILGIIGGRRR